MAPARPARRPHPHGWVVNGMVKGGARATLLTGKSRLRFTPARRRCTGSGTGKIKTGRLWTYVRDDHPAREQGRSGGLVRLLAGSQGRPPERHLHDFRGKLRADEYDCGPQAWRLRV